MLPTILFGLILVTAVLVLRGASRAQVLAAYAVSVLAVLLLFRHHMTDPLGLNF